MAQIAVLVYGTQWPRSHPVRVSIPLSFSLRQVFTQTSAPATLLPGTQFWPCSWLILSASVWLILRLRVCIFPSHSALFHARFSFMKVSCIEKWDGTRPVQALHPSRLLHVGAPWSALKTVQHRLVRASGSCENKPCLQRTVHAVRLASYLLEFLDPMDVSFWLHWCVILKHDWPVLWRKKGKIEYRTVYKALDLDIAAPSLCSAHSFCVLGQSA